MEEVAEEEDLRSRLIRIISCSLASLASSAWMSCVDKEGQYRYELQ